MRRLAWTGQAWADYLYWQAHDKKTLKRINALIKDVLRAPFEGIGKPEPLRFEFAGYWSRRIDAEHRLVYSFDAEEDAVTIVQCRFHY
jgi:toxin YoeB